MVKRQHIKALCLFGLILIAYLPVLMSHQTVDPDAQVILKNLTDTDGAVNYLRNLFHGRTIDFQPVRDLTLSFDLFMFHRFQVNTFILQNVFWWLLSLFLIYRISERLLLTVALGVYPLFSGVVAWGMNRKHLLAFFFILVATWMVIRRRQKWAPLFYALSVLSQPIHLLWVFWAGPNLRKEASKRYLTLLTVLFLGLAAINTYYYKLSETYQYFYPDKTLDLWNVSDRLLAIGHYLFQLCFPYLLSFKYDLSHWSVLAGILLFGGVLFLLWKKRTVDFTGWPLLGALPLVVVLTDPFVLSDAYLLLPAFAVFMVLLPVLDKIRKEWVLAGIIFWTFFTFRETTNWTSRMKLAEASFERRPSCLSAVNYVKVGYDHYESVRSGLRFIEENDCLRRLHVTPFFYVTMNILFAHYYFHETDLPLDARTERLTALKDKHHYAHLSLIGLLLKSNRFDQALAEAGAFGNFWRDRPITPEYHEITARLVHPFCKEKKIAACAAITSKLVVRPERPNL